MSSHLQIERGRTQLIRRRTKIVATVGPASATSETLEAMIEAGVDVFRLNFSHGSHEGHAAFYGTIREAAKTVGKHVAILGDLCGPKIRAGRFEEGFIDLEQGSEVVVTVREGEGRPGVIPCEYEALASDCRPGDRILLDDGKLELAVQASGGEEVRCTVVHGGRLSDRKGINLPGVAVSAPALTGKDREDALFAAELGVDFMALSFVRRASDVVDLKQLLELRGARAVPIISKIEKPEALRVIGKILGVTDGIMVARGDLGVEMAAEEVPLVQRELIRLAVEANRPVIVATQMLESMIKSATPTRAEVSDVASAAMAGADAVMLSGETAAGDHPTAAVATMDRVLRMVESYQWHDDQFGGLVRHDSLATDEATASLQLSEALSRAAAQLSRELAARAVVIPAHSGMTARMVSAERPAAPIIAVTDNEATCRRLALHWGVSPTAVEAAALDNPEKLAIDALDIVGLGDRGRFVLLVTGGTLEHQPAAPSIRLLMT